MTADKLDEAVRLLHDVRVQVEGIRARLESHVTQQDERTRMRDASQERIINDAKGTRDRVERLERFAWVILGGAAVVGGAAGKLTGVL